MIKIKIEKDEDGYYSLVFEEGKRKVAIPHTAAEVIKELLSEIEELKK